MSKDGLNNAIARGHMAKVDGSNKMVIGNTFFTKIGGSITHYHNVLIRLKSIRFGTSVVINRKKPADLLSAGFRLLRSF